jgi:hypothetical protein
MRHAGALLPAQIPHLVVYSSVPDGGESQSPGSQRRGLIVVDSVPDHPFPAGPQQARLGGENFIFSARLSIMIMYEQDGHEFVTRTFLRKNSAQPRTRRNGSGGCETKAEEKIDPEQSEARTPSASTRRCPTSELVGPRR